MAKHILVISQYFYPEQFRINDLCTEWVNRGYKVTVVTGIPNYPQGKFYDGYGIRKKRKEIYNGVEIIRIPIIPRGHKAFMLVLNYLSFVFSGFLWKLFTRIKADYVFIFEVSPMTQALPGVWYAKKRKIPCYLYVQDLWPENVEIVAGIKSKKILAIIERMVNYIYRNCDKILTTSKSFVQEVQKRVFDNKSKVSFLPQYAEEIYKPVEKADVPEIPDDNSFKIIFTGNIGMAQGLDILPRVAEKIKIVTKFDAASKTSDIKFVVVGDGRYKDKLIFEIAARSVEDMFIIIGQQPANRIPELLSKCNAAFLSFMDNFLFSMTIPAKLQSYMACGLPIIASASGESEKIIVEAKCGICSKIGDVESLTNNIILLSNMENSELKKMGQNSLGYCTNNYNKKNIMDQMDKLFL